MIVLVSVVLTFRQPVRGSHLQSQSELCLANLPSASMTRWLHSCNVYHFVYNIIKRENISICLRLSHRYCRQVDMFAVIFPCINKHAFQKLAFDFFFAESTVLRLRVNCKTFFAVILNGICLLALNVRVNN